jgi:hypothetical protein
MLNATGGCHGYFTVYTDWGGRMKIMINSEWQVGIERQRFMKSCATATWQYEVNTDQFCVLPALIKDCF